MKKENILPGVVLTLVCAIVCGLLAVVNALTYDKIAEAEANKVQKSLVAVFGEDTYTETGASFEGVTAVYSSSGGLTIYDITADGYSKGGIRALIGIDADGAIAGVGIVSCGETAGVGTKIKAAIRTSFRGRLSPRTVCAKPLTLPCNAKRRDSNGKEQQLSA